MTIGVDHEHKLFNSAFYNSFLTAMNQVDSEVNPVKLSNIDWEFGPA